MQGGIFVCRLPYRVGAAIGLQLQQPPFAAYETLLTDPTDYAITQQLGSVMRVEGVAAFEYVSARDANKGTNVALYTPEAFTVSNPCISSPGFVKPDLTGSSSPGRTACINSAWRPTWLTASFLNRCFEQFSGPVIIMLSYRNLMDISSHCHSSIVCCLPLPKLADRHREQAFISQG